MFKSMEQITADPLADQLDSRPTSPFQLTLIETRKPLSALKFQTLFRGRREIKRTSFNSISVAKRSNLRITKIWSVLLVRLADTRRRTRV